MRGNSDDILKHFSPAEDAHYFWRGPSIDGNVLLPIVDIWRHIGTEPEREALVFGSSRVTYGQLGALITAIHRQLVGNGLRPRDRVGLLMRPSIEAIATILAIHSARAAYVPLDETVSPWRVGEIAENLGISALAIDVASALESAELGVAVVRIGDSRDLGSFEVATKVPAVCDDDREDDEAYLIHTSGSSGIPKAVRVLQRHLAAMTAARRMVYPGAPSFLLLSPLAFDSSVAGLFGTLSAGGRLVIADGATLRDPGALAQLAVEERITHMLCVPSLYDAMLTATAGAPPATSIACIVLAGEAPTSSLVARHRHGPFAGAVLANEYGPTEATVWASYAVLEAGREIRIGRPAPGVGLAVMGADGALLRANCEGELIIAGRGVSAGYVGDEPDGQASPFFVIDGMSCYRTGDRVRRVGEELVFLGRIDQRVKIRGQWVDLSRLEDYVGARPDVADACAVQDETSGNLHLFVQPRSPLDFDAMRRDILNEFGPAWVPYRADSLNAMPRTATGKRDRRELERRAAVAAKVGRDVASGTEGGTTTIPGADCPTMDASALVISAWSTLLERGDLSHRISFFEQGGHSLLIFRLRDLLEKTSGVRLPIAEFFTAVTIEQQVALLSREMAARDREPDERAAPPVGSAPIAVPLDRQQRHGRQPRKARTGL